MSIPNVTVINKTRGKWTFATLVENVHLSDEIGEEYRIDRVTLISLRKLLRVSKRFGIKKESVDRWLVQRHNVPLTQSVAVVRDAGTPNDLREACLQRVRNELDLLSSCRLHLHRTKLGRIGVFGEVQNGVCLTMFQESKTGDGSFQESLSENIGCLNLSKSWRTMQRNFFFAKIEKLVAGKMDLGKSWANELLLAATLIGKSLNSLDVPTAFLFNMIALETLLTKHGDKHSEALPERIEALLGWIGYWKQKNFPTKIDEIYKKRCGLVHAGRTDIVLMEDVLFTDELLLNVLVNLLRHPKLFGSKEEVILFAKKVQAERLLGKKFQVRPKTLQYFHRTSLSKKDSRV